MFVIIIAMSADQTEYLPFHAINQFMLPEYRLNVLHNILENFDEVPSEQRSMIVNLFKAIVKIPGFRNSWTAPFTLRLKNSVSAFEQSPDFVGAVLMSWGVLHADLRQKVHDFLVSRGWEVLPTEADRMRLPGFQITWKKGETYEVLNQAFDETYPAHGFSENDVRLMIVWVAVQLPYDMYEDEVPQA